MRGFSKIGQGPTTVAIRYEGDKEMADRLRLIHGVRVMREFERLTYFQRLMQNGRTIRFDDGSYIHLQTRFGDKFATFYVPPGVYEATKKRLLDYRLPLPVITAPLTSPPYQRWQLSSGGLGPIGGFEAMPLFPDLQQWKLTEGEQQDYMWRYYQVPPGTDQLAMGWESHMQDEGRYPTNGAYYVDVKTETTLNETTTEYAEGAGPGGCTSERNSTQHSTDVLGVYDGSGLLLTEIARFTTTGTKYLRFDETGEYMDGVETLSGTVIKNDSTDHLKVHKEDALFYGGFYSTVTFSYEGGSLATNPHLTEESAAYVFLKGQSWEIASGTEWRGTMHKDYGHTHLFRTPEGQDIMVFGTVSAEEADSGYLPGYLPIGYYSEGSKINYYVFGGDRVSYEQTGTFGVAVDGELNRTTFAFDENGLANVGCYADGSLVTFNRMYNVALANKIGQIEE